MLLWGLPPTMVVEGYVNLPLNSGVHVPSGFPVANGQYARDFHAGKFKGRYLFFYNAHRIVSRIFSAPQIKAEVCVIKIMNEKTQTYSQNKSCHYRKDKFFHEYFKNYSITIFFKGL